MPRAYAMCAPCYPPAITHTVQLGNTIHNAATFCTGVGIAFWRGWDMTLVMLSVMPLLGAAGAGLAVSQAKLAARGAAAYAVAGTVASVRV